MMVRRALLVGVLVTAAMPQAGAQFGGMPGMPGGPGAGFGGPPAAPPPECQQILTIRDEVQKHGLAIEAANQKKAHVTVACRLFRNYLSAEARMIRALETSGSKCGVPPQIVQQVRSSHAKASQLGKQICEAAARPAQTGPSLSDALGTSPALPDASSKKGAGTFETLTGNPFQR